jgi:tripartite-type tricarboxylate transporter receptor subunit TctC
MTQTRRHTRLTRRAVLAGGALALGLPSIARAAYPERPVTILVPFAPGGANDVVVRAIQQPLAEALGQPIVVENRGGAGGTVGTRAVARAEPDGYTILLGYTGTLAIGPSLYANPGYDPRRDFTPIGMIGMAPMLLLVHPSLPANSVADLVAMARREPGKLNYASAGVGTVGHVAGELFAHTASIKLTHVPYKGTGPAVNDLLGGHVPISFSPLPPVLGNVQAGALRPLAVTSLQRSTMLPEVPTIAESGWPGFEAVLRYGLVAPAGTPRFIVDRLNAELRAALAAPDLKERFAIEGAEPISSTPEEYAADIDREETMWSGVVKASGAKGE